jgi:hypothetical protein
MLHIFLANILRLGVLNKLVAHHHIKRVKALDGLGEVGLSFLDADISLSFFFKLLQDIQDLVDDIK